MTTRSLAAVLFLVLAICGQAFAQTVSLVEPGARVAIIGDSITEQKLYSKYVECWLLASSGVPDVKVMQFGWSGERAGGFAARMANDLSVFKPTVATTCYGMNDGGYQPWKDEIGAEYRKNMEMILAKFNELGVKKVVIGSPGAVDFRFFRPGTKMGERESYEAYNDNLAHLRDICRAMAAESGQRFANVHDTMIESMKKAQEKLGASYDVCGRDGFHPGPNGQLLMAYAFLKGLGVDGQIGVVTIDVAAKKAEASPGHKVAGVEGTSATIESTRWPFILDGDEKNSGGTRSIAPFVPFHQDLNRFTLKVAGLTAPKAKVTWGSEAKEFPRERLAEGINLAAEFEKTPFDDSFRKLHDAVGAKQNFETFLIKQIVTNFRSIPGIDKDEEVQKAVDVLKRKLMAEQERLDGEVRKQLTPVRHTIAVEAVN